MTQALAFLYNPHRFMAFSAWAAPLLGTLALGLAAAGAGAAVVPVAPEGSGASLLGAAEDPARVGLTRRAAPRICILENDWLPHEVAPHIARFAEPYAGLLRRGGGADWTYDVFHVPAGEWPADETRYDAFILTGSRHDAFADTPWIVALRARVVSLVAARRKLVGICFGHQVLGHCLGAPVGRAPGGWHVGRFGYDWHGTGALHAGGEAARFYRRCSCVLPCRPPPPPPRPRPLRRRGRTPAAAKCARRAALRSGRGWRVARC
jgi:GMP synthase-like glutamine amidotransferase